MSEQTRLHATRYIWTAFGLVMLVMIAGASFNGQGMDVSHVVISIAVSIAAFLATGFVWNFGDVDHHEDKRDTAKAKVDSERLDKLMDELSPHEVALLRRRLADEDAEDGYYQLGEDGELLRQR